MCPDWRPPWPFRPDAEPVDGTEVAAADVGDDGVSVEVRFLLGERTVQGGDRPGRIELMDYGQSENDLPALPRAFRFTTQGIAPVNRVQLWEGHNAKALISLDIRTLDESHCMPLK